MLLKLTDASSRLSQNYFSYVEAVSSGMVEETRKKFADIRIANKKNELQT